MKAALSILLVFLTTWALCQSQTVGDSLRTKKHREIGFNATPLINSLIPFHIGSASSGLQSMVFKRYNAKNKAFKLTIGIRIEEFSDQFSFFHLGLGYEKRHDITEKWHYTSGWRVLVEADDSRIFGVVGIGPTIDYGLEYHITDRMYVSTGTSLKLLIGDGVRLNFLSPTALFFNVRL